MLVAYFYFRSKKGLRRKSWTQIVPFKRNTIQSSRKWPHVSNTSILSVYLEVNRWWVFLEGLIDSQQDIPAKFAQYSINMLVIHRSPSSHTSTIFETKLKQYIRIRTCWYTILFVWKWIAGLTKFRHLKFLHCQDTAVKIVKCFIPRHSCGR